MKFIRLLSFLFGILIISAACSEEKPTPTSSLTSTAILASADISTQEPAATQSIFIVTPDTRLPPDRWAEWPVVPTVSERMRLVYKQGQVLGRDPNHFSKVGDCQNVSSYFLGAFDNPGEYHLGEYATLQPAIDHFSGSWSRNSLAVKGGMNVASQLSPIWSNHEYCDKTESPLACEIRVYNPSIVIISLETNWDAKSADSYAAAMRQVVDYVISQGVVPILATKADNLEGDNSINKAIAQIAYDYDLPLWNFWAAVQPLPDHGIDRGLADGFHLTYAEPFFDDPLRMQQAWPWRNLTALQTIDSVWRGLTSQP